LRTRCKALFSSLTPSDPRHFHAQDTEAVLLVVEGDALDQPGDFFGRGSVPWGCVIHVWGLIFPWAAVPCVTSQKADFAVIGLPGGIGGGWGVSEALEAFVTTFAGWSKRRADPKYVPAHVAPYARWTGSQ
jgi:hypothetical protein